MNYYNYIVSYYYLVVYYYKKNQVDEQNTALWNKLIKKNVALKALYNIGENYLNKKILIENDVIILFSLFRTSYSYQYILLFY